MDFLAPESICLGIIQKVAHEDLARAVRARLKVNSPGTFAGGTTRPSLSFSGPFQAWLVAYRGLQVDFYALIVDSIVGENPRRLVEIVVVEIELDSALDGR